MPRTRNAERTRRALLDAAADLLAEKGAGLTLDQVAAAAGVSKSALLYHFTSRDGLVVAVVEDANARVRHEVAGRLDLSENQPGKMLRAYVRTLCDPASEVSQYYSSAPAWNGIYVIPEVKASLAEDAAWWSEQLALDGLDPVTITIIRRAAEGIAAAAAVGEEDTQRITAARDRLLALTFEGAL